MLSRTKKRLVLGISFISLLSVFHYLDVNSWISRFTYSADVKEKVNLSPALDSLSIIAFMRPDFVEKILSSVDFPITKLIVIVNKHSDAAVKEIRAVIENFTSSVENIHISSVHIIEPNVNAGYAGAVNLGIKAIKELGLEYTIFLNDDAVLLAGALKSIENTFRRHPNLCIYHYSKYVLWGLTKYSVKNLGYMDELLWPGYKEDCDYHYRSQVLGCENFYANGSFKYVEHGDYIDSPGKRKGGTTKRINPHIAALMKGVGDEKRGASAYLFKKWGPRDPRLRSDPLAKRRNGLRTNVCTEMHENLDARRMKEVRRPSIKPQSMYSTPYDEPNLSVRDWKREWRSKKSLSSRSVNAAFAPGNFQADE